MKQLVQNLKNGDMRVIDVPFPALGKKDVWVQTHYSVISTGTETRSVRDARATLVGKAKSRPQDVQKLLTSVKSNGLATTYRVARNRLESLSPLGYSLSGKVIKTGSKVTSVSVGDCVACGGQGAVHAQIVSVPENLLVRVPTGVSMEHAAFTTLGAIALQGVRRAQLQLGESCVVIGLGLVGQLTIALLKNAGVQVAGIDLDPAQVKLAEKMGADLSLLRSNPSLISILNDWTDGHGADGVIITASSKSRDPIDCAGTLCRKKGRVVVVGNIPTGFNRTEYYRKELDLFMSCSYGPGRYDPEYEDKGRDYPMPYVRWTENRNMKAFVTLLQGGKLGLSPLISHRFPFSESEKAYDMILQKKEGHSGIVLTYSHQHATVNKINLSPHKREPEKPSLGVIGAGSFVQSFLLPVLGRHANLVGLVNGRSHTSRHVAEKYGFEYCTGDVQDVFADRDINTIIIGTQHHLHAPYVIRALEAGKHVFVEKPLCITLKDLQDIRTAVGQTDRMLMVGFNRRFSPLLQDLYSLISSPMPRAINYRINAGNVPPDHWTQDPETGGGRILGEIGHFLDLLIWIAQSKIVTVSAHKFVSKTTPPDTISVTLGFQNGSIASLSYFSNGHRKLEKEHLEIFSGGQVVQLFDFKKRIWYSERIKKQKLAKADKGHQREILEFLSAIQTGKTAPISFEELDHTTQVTFAVVDALQTGKTVRMDYE